MRSVAPHIWMFNDGPKVFQCRKRQEVCCNISMKYCSMNFVIVSMPQAARGLLQLLDYYTVRTDLWEFQCRKRQEVCCNLLLCRQSRQRLVRFQCRKRQEVCCNSDNIYFFNWLSKVSMPQAARGLLQHWLCNRANPSTAGFNAASGKRSVATIRFRIWWSEQYVSMPQAARGLLQLSTSLSMIHAQSCFNAASGKRSVATKDCPNDYIELFTGFNAASGKRSVATVWPQWCNWGTAGCFNAASGKRSVATPVLTMLDMTHGSFNAASGKRSVATLCPGSRMNTGLKMRFWTTSTKKHPFGTFFAWTPFRFLVKNRLHPLLLKGSTCPWIFWTTYPRFDLFSRLSNCLSVYTFLLGSSSAW